MPPAYGVGSSLGEPGLAWFRIRSGEALIAASRVTRELPGAELHATLERVTAVPLPREVRGAIPVADLDLARDGEHALYITARQRDQSRIWSSALFVTLEA